MSVALVGNSVTTLTAGILLLSKARTIRQPLSVEILGDPDEITPVYGPALVHSPVLASCGVGRQLGSGALVIAPGPATHPLAVSLSRDGADGWFTLDRTGGGGTPAAEAFVALCRDRDPVARDLGRRLRRAFRVLGCVPEPVLIELMVSAPVEPFQRIATALRAGRAMSAISSTSLARFLGEGVTALPEAIPLPCSLATLLAARQDGRLAALVDRVSVAVHDDVETWIEEMLDLCAARPRFAPLLEGLADAMAPLLSLPLYGMLPPLGPAMDAVAVGVGPALGAAAAEYDANRALLETFRFLGGRFTTTARYPVPLSDRPAPDGFLERWSWLCTESRASANAADALWRRVIDPPQ